MLNHLFWGVAVLLHPLILRISSAPVSHEAHKLFSLVFTGGSFMRFGKDSFFYLIAIMSVLICRDRQKFPIVEKVIFSLLLLFAFFNQIDFLFPTVFYQWTMFGAGIVLLRSLYCDLDDKLIETIKKSFVISALIGSGWIFLEYMGVKPYRVYASILDGVSYASTHNDELITGVLNHPNMSGAYLSIALPFFLTKSLRLFALPILCAICLCDSALPILTAIATVGYYLYSQVFGVSLWPFYAAIVLGVILFFTGVGGLDNERFIIWETALRELKGAGGLGYFADTFYLNHTGNLGKARHVHSEWIELYLVFGAVGLICFNTLLSKAVSGAKPIFAAGLFGVFVNSYGNHLFHLSTLAFLGLFIYATCLYQSERENATL